MEFDSHEIGHAIVFRPLAKRIDASKSAEFKVHLNELIEEGGKFIVLNLSLIEFMDSSGLGAIVSNSKALKIKGGTLILFGLSSSVMNLFKLTGMDKVLEIYPDEAEAVKGMEAKLHPSSHPPSG